MTDVPKSRFIPPSVLQYSSYREYLRDYVQFHKAKNRSWSYAVWARKLGLASKSSLVMIMQGQRNPGPELVEKIATSMEFSEAEKDHFIRLVQSEKKTKDSVARLVFLRGHEVNRRERRRQWLYLVLLDLCQLPNFIEDPRWIREQLMMPIDESEIQECLDQMFKDSLTEKNTTSRKLSEDEILKFHEDGSQASTEALLRAQRDERAFMTSILRISKDKLPQAREIMQQTQTALSALLQSNDGDSVYELHLHLFPLTK